MPRLMIGVLLAVFGTVASSGATVRVERHQVVLRAERSPVIVELTSPDALSHLRRDLARDRIASNAASAPAAIIRHEYSRAYLGAALEVTREGRERLRTLPYVRAVHEDKRVQAYATEAAHDAAARVRAAALPTRGKGVVIAVIDSGIDYTHDSLGGGFGDGFKVAGGWDFVNGDGDPMDDGGHGTHVAAILAGQSKELLGVAPDATLIAYKVLAGSGSGLTSDVIAAIERSLDPNGDGDPSDRVDVINLSLGGPGTADDPASQAVDAAVRAGVIVCVAAGNSGGAMTIGSPGTARLAITVGASDEFDQVAFFSSKGPTARTFEFKPDLVAPGNMIWSAKRGGGIVQMSGTSMATPHVAGAAALLKSLNRTWTPAMIKAALTASARPLQRSSDPFAHGAGNLDVEAAASARLLPEVSGVSFGLNASKTGVWEQARLFRVTNSSQAIETVAVAIDAMAMPGVTVTATPAQLTLQPGGSAEVTITARADNPAVEFPPSLSIGGQLELTGTRATSIPWVFLRAARATVTYSGGGDGVTMRMANNHMLADGTRIGEREFDFILPADRYDLIAEAVDVDAQADKIAAIRYIIRENVNIDGEVSVAVNRDEAVHHFKLEGVDPFGTSLSSLDVTGQRVHLGQVRLNFQISRDDALLDASLAFAWAGGMSVFMSPASARYKVLLSQIYLDAEEMRSYAVSYPVLSGVSEGRTFTSDPSRYVRGTVRMKTRDGKPAPGGPCLVSSDTRPLGSIIVESPCYWRVVPDGTAFDAWATPDASPDAHLAASLISGSMHLAPLRAFGNAIVPTFERTASDADLRIPRNGEVTMGLGPLHPFGAFGIGSRVQNYLPGPSLIGPLGERHVDTRETAFFRIFDETGAKIANGWPHPFEGTPELKPGYRVEVVHEALLGRARGTMQVKLAAGTTDLTAPAISSLSVRDVSGLPADRFTPGSIATLMLSAGDYTFGIFPRLAGALPLRSVRAFYRAGDAWQAVTLTKSAHETTDRHDSGHWPAGESYRGDLTSMTSAGNDTWVDLRIELEDAAGNTMSWTQEQALSIGTPPPPPSAPKRRSAR